MRIFSISKTCKGRDANIRTYKAVLGKFNVYVRVSTCEDPNKYLDVTWQATEPPRTIGDGAQVHLLFHTAPVLETDRLLFQCCLASTGVEGLRFGAGVWVGLG